MIRIELPWRKPPLRANDRRSFHAQALHYQPATRRTQDADGIAPTLKPVLDALVQEGVLPDDSWVCVPRTSQQIHPPVKGEPSVMWLELADITYFEERPA